MLLRRRALLPLGLAPLLPSLAGAAPGLQFPRDFGAHPQSQLEWWYLTGILRGPDGSPRYGYQLTFFRLRGPAPADHPSAFAASQLLLGHAALSDLQAGRLRHEQRIARQGLGLAEAALEDCRVHIRDWQLERTAQGYQARFDAGSFALELRLQTTQPVLLQGQAGLSRKGPRADQFSRYYSQVQLQTEARLRLDGKAQTLQGRSWLDHEWSDKLLGGADSPDRAVGWDWLGINLHDGGALTLFQLRRADGSRLWAGGSWRRADGRQLDLPPESLGFTAGRRWRSAASQAEYPVEWQLQTPLGLLKAQALFDAQELDARHSSGLLYWEGATRLSDAQGRELGLGYLEMTGYAGPLALPG